MAWRPPTFPTCPGFAPDSLYFQGCPDCHPLPCRIFHAVGSACRYFIGVLLLSLMRFFCHVFNYFYRFSIGVAFFFIFAPVTFKNVFFMLNHIVKNTSIGLLGLGASVAAPEVIPTDPSTWSAIMEVVTQVVIAVATLLSLFKKKKV